MTNIVGKLSSSTGVGITGTLYVVLPGLLISDLTIPDTVYTPVEDSFTVTAGVVDIEVPESETYEVAYNFRFVDSIGTELINIDAIVPNVGTVEFASLLPTGITNRNLDDGALRVARLLASNPTLSQRIKQPAIFSKTLDAVSAETKFYMPKPFPGALLAKSLTVLGISGYEAWDFYLGVVNSAGGESIFPVETVITTSGGGRQRLHMAYGISNAENIFGLFMVAAPQAGAGTLTATMSVAYSDIT